MKKLFFPALVVITAFVFTGCSTSNPRYVSASTIPNTTFFRQQGDWKISTAGVINAIPHEKYNYSSDGNANYQDEKNQVYGADGQAAVAVTDHFMIAVDGSFRDERDKYNNDDLNPMNDASEITYRRKLLNAGAGFYTPLGMSSKAWFSMLGMVGVGSVNSKDNGLKSGVVIDRRYYDASLLKFTIHPSFNFFFSDYFRMAVSPRFSFLNFNNIKTNYTPDQLSATQYDALPGHYAPLFEPSIVLQAGFRRLEALKVDLGFHASSAPDIGADNLHARPLLISLGVSLYPFTKRTPRPAGTLVAD